MDKAAISPIALVEAAYNLEVAPAEWLPNLLRAAGPIFDLGLGCAATIWAGASDDGEPLVSQLHAVNGPADLATRFAHAARSIDPGIARSTRMPCEPGVHTLVQARCRHQAIHEALTKHVDCKDMLTLWAIGPDHQGVGIHIPSQTVIELSRQARARWRTLSIHIEAGHRLRRRLGQTASGQPVTRIPLDAEALLERESFSVSKAARDAKSRHALDEIRRGAMGVDLDRGRLRNDETCEAIRLWEAVLRGQWSMVDWFDADGRRFILALPHASHVRDPRGLTEREYQVATHVGAGESSKLIAYRLGVSRSRVSELLRRVMHKLGVQNTGQLVIKMRTLLVESRSNL